MFYLRYLCLCTYSGIQDIYVVCFVVVENFDLLLFLHTGHSSNEC